MQMCTLKNPDVRKKIRAILPTDIYFFVTILYKNKKKIRVQSTISKPKYHITNDFFFISHDIMAR